MFGFKNSIVSALLLAGLLSFGIGHVAYAQEDVSAEVLTEAERQAILQEIATQLDEIAQEVAELSLLVNKYVLEQQALALQEQIEQEQARLVTGETPAVVPPPVAVQAPEPAAEEPADEAVEPITSVAAQEPASEEEEEDIFAGVEITEETEEQQGFLAAIQAFGRNLGTPELATIAILAFLAAFLLVRRMRDRRAGVKKKEQPQEPEAQDTEHSRQELQERISWQ